VNATPSITTLSPTSGAVGTSVTIHGNEFRGNTRHEHSAVNGDCGYADELECDKHRGAGANGSDDGERGGGRVWCGHNGVSFTVVAGPSIASLSPDVALLGHR